MKAGFLSTLSLRRATRTALCHLKSTQISIHALLAESDIFHRYCYAASTRFLSTLSLRRATRISTAPATSVFLFLSTLSLRRATRSGFGRVLYCLHFYPRSPCGERPKPCTRLSGRDTISIHALLAESDRRMLLQAQAPRNFYPRSPCGERP